MEEARCKKHRDKETQRTRKWGVPGRVEEHLDAGVWGDWVWAVPVEVPWWLSVVRVAWCGGGQQWMEVDAVR